MLAACSPDEYMGGLGKHGTSRLSLQGSQKTLDCGKAGLLGVAYCPELQCVSDVIVTCESFHCSL